MVMLLALAGVRCGDDAPGPVDATAGTADAAPGEAAGTADAAPGEAAGTADAAPTAAPREAGVAGDAGGDAPALEGDAAAALAGSTAAHLYGLQVGARWSYLRSGGVLRWKEITACEDVVILDEQGRPLRTVRAYVRENRSTAGTTSVHYLVEDERGVHRVRRDDVDQGNLTMVATYQPPGPRLLNGPYTRGRTWEFSQRTAEFDRARGTSPVIMFRGATNTSAVDLVESVAPRVVVAGTFPTVGVDRTWAANNAHNVQSYYAPGIGEIVEATIWPGTPLPTIQIEELVSHTPGYGSCDGSPPTGGGPCDAPRVVCDRPWGKGARGCTDPRVDAANCGACGNVCQSGVCSNGKCQVSRCDLSCGGTTICCPSAWRWGIPGCTSPSRDPWNCGGCGIRCSPGQVCEQGACTCAPGTQNCGQGCRDVLSDPKNCGACGRVCGGDAPKCSMGICYGTCAALDLLDCGGKCVDPAWDDANCGACGRKCGPGTGTVQCRLGECVPCAKAGYADCGGTCHDLAWTNEHCGACGHACQPGEVCAFGKCIGGDGTCKKAACKDPDKICCNGDCINPRTSDNHCGGCGVAKCAGGCQEACRQGICSLVDCGGGDD